ncbi:MAG TPA: nucleoside deaminase [Bacteroidetes bacterium]|nr:nucleoside deaminase [Bacteroidota bacterium]
MENNDEKYMRMAIDEAEKALARDEVPIGSVVVFNNMVIARAHNLTETLKDPTAHAEMQAITAAANWIGGKYLKDCTIYVTIEPCPMCAAALNWAQVSRVVYGANDEKRGYSRISSYLLHPKTSVVSGVLGYECGTMVTDFFKSKR